LQTRDQPLAIIAHGGIVSRDLQRVADAAAHARQSCRGQVIGVQQQARRDVDELHAAIRLKTDDAGHLQARIAQFQRIADANVQERQERRVQPDRAGGGDA